MGSVSEVPDNQMNFAQMQAGIPSCRPERGRISGQATAYMYERLRRAPSNFTVHGSLPVLFFGDLFTARIATVGLNPSKQEYLSPEGRELTASSRRFETMTSLGVENRTSLTDAQCDRAIRTMRRYFQPGQPVYRWFRPLDRVIQGVGYSYVQGNVVHLDLVQEATDPTWSRLLKTHPSEARALMAADLPFLRWVTEMSLLTALICNGSTPFLEVCKLLDGRVVESGRFGKKVSWRVALADGGDAVTGIAGWNMTLARAGLRKEEETELGRLLRIRLDRLVSLPPE